jgi:NADPH:quinone reductase-like Zn-dependent oxidoreductase
VKAAVIDRYGTTDVVHVKDVASPAPKPHEVRLRVHAASVNDWDLGILRGSTVADRLMNGLRAPRVRILGCDVAGRVDEVGAAVKELRPGDEVYGDLSFSGFGAFAEQVCAPETALARKPAAMSFEQAAAIPQAAMLAVQGLLDVGGVRAGQDVLLNGAGGGVGTFALQLARLHGAVVTVVDKASKLDMLRSLGAHHGIDYLTADFTRLGRRYELILDVRTNRSPLTYTAALKPGGTYATVGGDYARLLQTFLLGAPVSRLSGKHLRVVALKPNKDLALVNDLFVSGKLVPVIDSTYPLAEVREALRRFASGDHQGKVVVTMS